VRLRAACPADAPAIAALLEQAFGGSAEAALVATLREAGDAVIELVAEAPGGAILGHILFSPMQVGQAAALALAPLAVAPEAQRRGIGTALVRQGLALAAARPEAWCLVLGEPAYYSRFGFAASAAATVTGVPWSGHPAFQALRLSAEAPPLDGAARYAYAFGLDRDLRV
jgi:putative acetyltransferase